MSRAPDEADRGADCHLDRELATDHEQGGVVACRELDHPDHQSDARGVVHPGLALQRGARPPADLASTEDGEHDRRIGWC